MSDPLPAVPIWMATLTHDWTAVESFRGVLVATLRKKQIERLKSARDKEFTCRTHRPGLVKLYARRTQEEE